jgi:hypothetical protein
MAKLPVYQQLQNIALEIISNNPGGIHYGDLIKRIAADNPETPINTIHGSVWDLATRFPEKVVKPSRGLFKPANVESSEEVVPTPIPKMKEDAFYSAFAEYLKNDLDEVTTVSPLGGCGMKGKWGTPDVIGVYKSLASNLLKFPPEIVSAEIKIDAQAPVVAFGQAVAYRLFSAKCYVVMPNTISDEDLSRLEALCMLFGVGLVLFVPNSKAPEFFIRVRAQRFSPDMFYVNEFARRLHQYDAALFEKLFS